MRIAEVMKHEPSSVAPSTTLAEAGRTMATIGCGILPVVDERHRVIGVITDRDICVTLTRTDTPASVAPVGSAMSAPAHTCRASDDVESALSTLGYRRIRRLPVVDAGGRLCGLFSLDDAALLYADEEPRRDHAAAIAAALRAVCSPALPAVR